MLPALLPGFNGVSPPTPPSPVWHGEVPARAQSQLRILISRAALTAGSPVTVVLYGQEAGETGTGSPGGRSREPDPGAGVQGPGAAHAHAAPQHPRLLLPLFCARGPSLPTRVSQVQCPGGLVTVPTVVFPRRVMAPPSSCCFCCQANNITTPCSDQQVSLVGPWAPGPAAVLTTARRWANGQICCSPPRSVPCSPPPGRVWGGHSVHTLQYSGCSWLCAQGTWCSAGDGGGVRKRLTLPLQPSQNEYYLKCQGPER